MTTKDKLLVECPECGNVFVTERMGKTQCRCGARFPSADHVVSITNKDKLIQKVLVQTQNISEQLQKMSADQKDQQRKLKNLELETKNTMKFISEIKAGSTTK